MSTNAELYDASRARIVELVTGADLSAPVPACPGWTVQDLVAHLAGGLGAFTARDFDAGEYANHGDRVVHERRGRAFEEHLDEWETNRAEADDTLAGPMGSSSPRCCPTNTTSAAPSTCRVRVRIRPYEWRPSDHYRRSTGDSGSPGRRPSGWSSTARNG